MEQMSSSGQPQNSGRIGTRNVTGSYNTIVNLAPEIDDKHQILQWLSPLDPKRRHRDVQNHRIDGVGNWVLETSDFRKWSGGEDGCVEPVLFCYGNPGAGKTYVSSLVIDGLCDQAGGKDIAVVAFYCDYLAQQEQSATNMLGAILKQLVSRGWVPDHISEAFQKAKNELAGRPLRLSDMVYLLNDTIKSLPRVFICIDALDECKVNYRRELLESLREIVARSPNIRVFLTARPIIEEEIVRYFIQLVRIPLSPTDADIKSYLKRRLACDTDPDAMDGGLWADIMRIIPEKISESFLLISLNMDAILGEVTLNRRRRKLEEMTKGKGLGDAYDATLSRIKAQSGSRSKLGMEVLMWVSHAERPLQADELCHALGVEQESTDLDIWNIPTIKTLLACSLGLITVENSSSTIQLVHYTLHEYLSHNPNLFLKPHSTIAEACLTYLNFPHVRGFSPGLSSPPPTAPLVEYASCHWGTHAKRETTESVKTLALKLLDGYDKHISSKILLLRGVGLWNPPIDWEGTPKGFTGLHGAAYLGCVEVTAALLESGRWDAQATDFNGNTAIAWAARMGHEGVVRVLLGRRDTNPDKADRWGQTPLLWAAEKGHEGVVRALLERSDVNPNTADEYGRTPFSGAAMNGHEVVVRMLLERKDVDPNTADTEDGRTPLSFAAQNGHVGVVKMLLEREDVDPNKPDQSNVTPLSRAAQNGHLGVVKTLLERKDVDPNIADTEDGRTPLSFAAENGYVGVVKYLLEREEVDPNTADTEYGQTPLSFAAMNGHEGAVSILLNRNDVDPGITDNWNSTPLSWAATYGHEGIIRLLQESRI